MMVPYRASLYLVLFAGGVACGYAFLRPYHAPVQRIVFQDTTGQAKRLYLAPSLSLSFEMKTSSANSDASGDIKPKTQATAVPMPSGAQELALALQKELTRVGCYSGLANGDWDQRSKSAMKVFIDLVNARLPVDRPDPSLLALARNTPGSVCRGSQAPSSITAAATTPKPPLDAVSPGPLDLFADGAPSPMGLGGPIMVPVGTIAEGEASVRPQVIAIVPATASPQAEDTLASRRPRSFPRPRAQYENRNLFIHPLGF